jgi:hypothetical protein
VAVRDTVLSRLSRAEFGAFAETHLELYKSMITLLTQRLRETNVAVAAGSFLSLRGRVIYSRCTQADDRIWRPCLRQDDAKRRKQHLSALNRSLPSFYRGVTADTKALAAALPALLETADELRAIAKILGAKSEGIKLGEARV